MRRIVQGMHLEPATGKLTPQGAKRLFAVLTQAMAEDEIPADHPEIVAICCEELEQVVMQFCQHVSDIEVNCAYETLFPDAVETDAAAVQIQSETMEPTPRRCLCLGGFLSHPLLRRG